MNPYSHMQRHTPSLSQSNGSSPPIDPSLHQSIQPSYPYSINPATYPFAYHPYYQPAYQQVYHPSYHPSYHASYPAGYQTPYQQNYQSRDLSRDLVFNPVIIRSPITIRLDDDVVEQPDKSATKIERPSPIRPVHIKPTFDQSLEHSDNQSINQTDNESLSTTTTQSAEPTNQSINQAITQSLHGFLNFPRPMEGLSSLSPLLDEFNNNHSNNHSNHESNNQPINYSNIRSSHESNNQAISHSDLRSNHESNDQPINQSTKQSINQSINESNNQLEFLSNSDMLDRVISSNQSNSQPRLLSPFGFSDRVSSFSQVLLEREQSLDESIDQSVDQSVDQSDNQTPSPLVYWPDHQQTVPIVYPDGQLIDQPINPETGCFDPTLWVPNNQHPNIQTNEHPSFDQPGYQSYSQSAHETINQRLEDLRARINQARDAQRYWLEKAQSTEQEWASYNEIHQSLPLEQQMEIVSMLNRQSKHSESMLMQWHNTHSEIMDQYNAEIDNLRRTEEFEAYCQAITQLSQQQSINQSINQSANQRSYNEPQFTESTGSESTKTVEYDDRRKKKRKSSISTLRPSKKLKVASRSHDPHAPARPLTSFFLFHQARLKTELKPSIHSSNQSNSRPSQSSSKTDGSDGQRQTEISGNIWSKMTQEEKRPYEDQFREKNLEYQISMEQYERRLREDQPRLVTMTSDAQIIDDNMSVLSRTLSMRSTSVSSNGDVVTESYPASAFANPNPRPKTAYRMFVDEYVRKHAGKRAPRDLKLEARKVWEKEMKESDKRPYHELHRKAKREFDSASHIPKAVTQRNDTVTQPIPFQDTERPVMIVHELVNLVDQSPEPSN